MGEAVRGAAVGNTAAADTDRDDLDRVLNE
jgi:hypothetical protein